MPVPKPQFLWDEVSGYIRLLSAQIGRCYAIPYRDIIAQYRGGKRRRYEEAEANLLSKGDVLEERDGFVNMFIKQEPVKFSKDKPEPDCRAIQFRSFEYTLYLASRIRMCEKRLFALKDVPGMGPGMYFAKGMTDVEVAGTLRSKYDALGGDGVKIYGFDISRCDAHINAQLLRIEQALFTQCNPDSGLRRALKMQLNNRGSFGVRTDDGYFRQKYAVRGERMSGDSNTSVGTCVIISVILSIFGNGHYPGEFAFLCNGDDSSFMFKGDWLDDDVVVRFFHRFGLSVKIELKTRDFEQIEFCQSKPILISQRWMMVRNPSRVATKLGFTKIKMSLGLYARYVRTVALGELSRLRGVPVLQPFLQAVIRDTESVMLREKIKGIDLRAIRDNFRFGCYLPGDWMEARVEPITLEARVGYERSWDVPVSEQIRIEQDLVRGLTPTGVRYGRPIGSLFPTYWDYDWERIESYNVSC